MAVLEPPDASGRLLAIAPHPDDESLALGGLLAAARQAGTPLRLLFLTSGDNNPWPQRVLERRLFITPQDQVRWAERRRQEARAALERLGVDPADAVFLNYPDQGLTRHLLSGRDDLIQRLAQEIAQWRPTLLACASPRDLHPDHNAAPVLLRLALDRVPEEALPARTIHFLVHRRGGIGGDDAGMLRLPLAPEIRQRKREAIAAHVSQVKFREAIQLAHAEGDEIYYANEFAEPAQDWTSNLPESKESSRLIYPIGPISPIGPIRPIGPITESAITGDDLRLGLRLGFHLGAFGKATLLLAAARRGRLETVAELPLPRRGGIARMKIRHIQDGVRLAAEAEFHGSYRDAELRIPLAPLLPLDRLFAKIERRIGFFDEAGWRSL